MDNPPPLRCVACDRVTNEPESLGEWGVLFCSPECTAATVAALRLEEHLGVRYYEDSGAYPRLTNHADMFDGISVQWLNAHTSDMNPTREVWLMVVRFWTSPLVLRLHFDATANRPRVGIRGIEDDTTLQGINRAGRAAALFLDHNVPGRPPGRDLTADQFRDLALGEWAKELDLAKQNNRRPARTNLAAALGISPSTLSNYLRECGVKLPRR